MNHYYEEEEIYRRLKIKWRNLSKNYIKHQKNLIILLGDSSYIVALKKVEDTYKKESIT